MTALSLVVLFAPGMRLLFSKLSVAERAAAASALRTATGSHGRSSPCLEFDSPRRALLIEAEVDDDTLRYHIVEALDAAADDPQQPSPVFVAVTPALPSVSDASHAVEQAVLREVAAYGLRRPLRGLGRRRAQAGSAVPIVNAVIDGAMVDGRWDVSSVVAVDGLVDERLRAALLSLLHGSSWSPERGADPDYWSRGAFADTMAQTTGASLGLRDDRLAALCTDGAEAPWAVRELQARLVDFLHAANSGAKVDVCRMPEATLGPGVTPLAANAPVATDGAELFGWHIDADPALLPPSPWTDVHGRYPNRRPGKPRFVTALVYLSPEWQWPEWGAPTRCLDPPTADVLAVPPAPGRVLLMDQDISHAVTAPTAAAGDSPRYPYPYPCRYYPYP